MKSEKAKNGRASNTCPSLGHGISKAGKITTVFVIVALAFVFLSFSPFESNDADSTTAGDVTYVHSWTEMQNAVSDSSVSTIKLSADLKYGSGNGTFNISRSITIDLDGHTIDMNGGGASIFNVSNSSVNLVIEGGSSKGTLTGGSADKGGAICISAASSVTLNNLILTLNYAADGGAIYSEGTTLTINESKITSNFSNNSGGGICTNNCTINITGTEFKDNSAGTYNGGAIEFKGGALNLNNVTITGNRACENGGGIDVYDGIVNVKGNTVVNGNLAGFGDNIRLYDTNYVRVVGDLGSNAMLDITAPRNDVAYNEKKTIAKFEGVSPSSNVQERFSYNGYTQNAVWDESSGTICSEIQEYKRASRNPVLVDNWVDLEKLFKEAESGTYIVMTKNITAASNQGCLKFDRDSYKKDPRITLDLNGFTLSRDRSKSDGEGHVIKVKEGTVVIRDYVGTGVITGGYADNGGGINIGKDGICIINGATVKGNTAKEDGGGVCVNGYLEMHRCAIIGNTAKDDGGGISSGDDSWIYGEHSVISNNTAKVNGGGMHLHCISHDNFDDIYVSCNRISDGDGGGIHYDAAHYYDDKGLWLSEAYILGNSCTNKGGGLYNDKGDNHIEGGAISWNSAKEGGGVYTDEWMTISNVKILYNSATADGGGMYLNDSYRPFFHINDCNVDYNTAGKSGGAIRAHGGTAYFYGGSMNNNSVKENGGAVYLGNEGKLYLKTVTVTGNQAKLQAGAILVDDAADGFYMEGAIEITDNKADGDGQGVYLRKGKKIEMTGALSNGSLIDVAKDKNTGVFTSGFSAKNPNKDPALFFEAADGYEVNLNGKEASIDKDDTGTDIDDLYGIPIWAIIVIIVAIVAVIAGVVFWKRSH